MANNSYPRSVNSKFLAGGAAAAGILTLGLLTSDPVVHHDTRAVQGVAEGYGWANAPYELGGVPYVSESVRVPLGKEIGSDSNPLCDLYLGVGNVTTQPVQQGGNVLVGKLLARNGAKTVIVEPTPEKIASTNPGCVGGEALANAKSLQRLAGLAVRQGFTGMTITIRSERSDGQPRMRIGNNDKCGVYFGWSGSTGASYAVIESKDDAALTVDTITQPTPGSVQKSLDNHC